VVHTLAGPPVDLSRWQGREIDATVLDEVTAEIMRHVTRLLEQLRDEPAPDEVFDPRALRDTATG
jgi:1-acyl-sn-glycerol-3-phosphate acyltransferase